MNKDYETEIVYYLTSLTPSSEKVERRLELLLEEAYKAYLAKNLTKTQKALKKVEKLAIRNHLLNSNQKGGNNGDGIAPMAGFSSCEYCKRYTIMKKGALGTGAGRKVNYDKNDEKNLQKNCFQCQKFLDQCNQKNPSDRGRVACKLCSEMKRDVYDGKSSDINKVKGLCNDCNGYIDRCSKVTLHEPQFYGVMPSQRVIPEKPVKTAVAVARAQRYLDPVANKYQPMPPRQALTQARKYQPMPPRQALVQARQYLESVPRQPYVGQYQST